MKTKIAINGFGRIGRLAFRIALNNKDLQIVAVNDLLPIKQLAYLLKYDSVHGKLDADIKTEGDNKLIVNGNEIRVTAEKNPENLKWDEVQAKIIIDCTGIFKTQELASLHLKAGAEKVIISAPTKDIPMFVMGVNHAEITAEDKIISNASCTTNCLAPLAKVIHDNFGIVEGLMTTVHAVTATQSTVDAASKKNFRIGRSAVANIIPTSTGAALAVGKVIPALEGKLTGMAFRVPTPNVSVVDLTVRTEKPTSFQALKQAVKKASENELKGILAYTEDAVVSQDFVSDAHISTFDAEASIALNENFFKLVAWYDNEYGYSAKLIDMVAYIAAI
ncbi:glyceraldehyde 3-phosphate dehydrogenase [Mesonia hippocampi]|uniref:Glyceraldehyde-3-phosphate dehydrogenase n=1 Tax=Mesonia hippocampi TaxID=1628250 RepID=A0A840EI43_9FLAO|nr:type I glyceraldehyde-3-phosphate dehydrogenase [Mesonia hippocampi]MBB4118079.1 glyceraldehyde 3-phosphate dehydrogenase [Mesonia hippocampi]